MDVHGNIQATHGGAEECQPHAQGPGRVDNSQYRQGQYDPEAPANDDGLAANSRAHDPAAQHRNDRAAAQAKQEDAENTIIHAEASLRKRNERSPTGKAEASDEEGK